MKYKLFFIAMIAVILKLIAETSLLAAGVQPLLIERTAKPGDTVSFDLKIIPGITPEKVKLKLYRITQQINGDFGYETTNPALVTLGDWLKIPAEVTTHPGTPNLVNGVLKVPFDAGGTYTAAIMVEPAEPWKKGRINFMVRYAVRIYLRVERPGLKPSAKITKFDMSKGKTGEPVILMQALNTSLVDFSTSALITFRDNHKKLVERVELKPESGFGHDLNELRLLPGSEIQYTGSPKKLLLPGQYDLQLFYRYGKVGQILLSKTVNIREGDYLYPIQQSKVVQVEPTELSFSGGQGTTAMKAVKFINHSDRPVLISVEIVDIEPDYPYSILNNTKLEMKGDHKFTLDPGRIATNILMVKFPGNGEVQGSYGVLRVKVYSDDANPKLIEESTVNLAATITGKYCYRTNVTGITGGWDAGTYIISVVIKNTGNVRTVPAAQALMKDYHGKLIETINLRVEGRENCGVLPGKAITLSGQALHLKTGKYKAQIIINNGEQSIGTTIMDLVVK